MNLVKDHFGTIHHNYLFTERNFEKILDRFPFMYDEPFWDYSGFPTYKVSEMARKYVTVVLSGDGGDEIFGGYASHLMGARMDLLRKTPKALRKILSRLPVKKNFDSAASLFLLKEAMALSLKKKKSFYAESLRDGAYKPEVYRKWTEDKLRYSLGKGGNSLAEGLRVYDLLFGTLQDNFLVKVDRASMQAPVEVRSPFLDYRFVEFAQRIPTKWKATPGKTKVLMREIIKGIVPGEIVNRGKQGFEPPLDKWIRRGKYEKYMKKRLPLLKSFSPELYGFYAGRVFRENGRFYSVYRIKLFLFLKWWDKWIAR
jgi:asparagine synthase (glutamine-hydrolysing)